MIPPLFGDMVVSCPGGSWRCQAVSKEVSGGQGKPRAPESGLRALGEAWDDFLLEAFSCQVTRRAFTCCFSYNAHRVIRKRENDDLYLTLPKRVLG